jgi:hypothetical protein
VSSRAQADLFAPLSLRMDDSALQVCITGATHLPTAKLATREMAPKFGPNLPTKFVSAQIGKLLNSHVSFGFLERNPIEEYQVSYCICR